MKNQDWFAELGDRHDSNSGISSRRMTSNDHCMNKIIDYDHENHAFPMSGGTVKVFKRALMSLWVQKYFQPNAKAALMEMWATFQSTLERVFEENTWMDDMAKKNAIGKLGIIEYSGAYDDEILDKASMQTYHDTFLVETMDPNAFIENQVNSGHCCSIPQSPPQNVKSDLAGAG